MWKDTTSRRVEPRPTPSKSRIHWFVVGSLAMGILSGIVAFDIVRTPIAGSAKVLFFIFLGCFVASAGFAWAAKRRSL
jgi:hypothetical protein